MGLDEYNDAYLWLDYHREYFYGSEKILYTPEMQSEYGSQAAVIYGWVWESWT